LGFLLHNGAPPFAITPPCLAGFPRLSASIKGLLCESFRVFPSASPPHPNLFRPEPAPFPLESYLTVVCTGQSLVQPSLALVDAIPLFLPNVGFTSFYKRRFSLFFPGYSFFLLVPPAGDSPDAFREPQRRPFLLRFTAFFSPNFKARNHQTLPCPN